MHPLLREVEHRPLATARRPLDHDANLARSPLRPLANPASRTPSLGPSRTESRYIRRPMLDRSRAVLDERRSCSRPPGHTRPLVFSRTERADLCDLWRQARRLFLQPRCCQSRRRLGCAHLLSPSLFSRFDEVRRTRWSYRLLGAYDAPVASNSALPIARPVLFAFAPKELSKISSPPASVSTPRIKTRSTAARFTIFPGHCKTPTPNSKGTPSLPPSKSSCLPRPPLLHFSKRLEVLIWPLRRADQTVRRV